MIEDGTIVIDDDEIMPIIKNDKNYWKKIDNLIANIDKRLKISLPRQSEFDKDAVGSVVEELRHEMAANRSKEFGEFERKGYARVIADVVFSKHSTNQDRLDFIEFLNFVEEIQAILRGPDLGDFETSEYLGLPTGDMSYNELKNKLWDVETFLENFENKENIIYKGIFKQYQQEIKFTKVEEGKKGPLYIKRSARALELAYDDTLATLSTDQMDFTDDLINIEDEYEQKLVSLIDAMDINKITDDQRKDLDGEDADGVLDCGPCLSSCDDEINTTYGEDADGGTAEIAYNTCIQNNCPDCG